ncbi:MAG: hypothetical protein ACOH13_07735 [Flavobacteriales bacterium]
MSRNAFPFFAALALLSACGSPATENPAPQAAPTNGANDTLGTGVHTDTTSVIQLQPLRDSRLRFDGVYDQEASGNLHYYMRFFERGNVALVAGVQKPDDPGSLQDLLTPNAQSGANNVHNVPVTLRGDSILFSTMTAKGAITYAGIFLGGDTLRFLKASDVTGKKAVLDYAFRPDSPLK